MAASARDYYQSILVNLVALQELSDEDLDSYREALKEADEIVSRIRFEAL